MLTHEGQAPLEGLNVIELESLGPVPFAGLVLHEMGANVTLVERSGSGRGFVPNRRSPMYQRSARVDIDLKTQTGKQKLLAMLESADVLLEGYRPGVLERLGLDPSFLRKRFTELIVVRSSAWGESGPDATLPGHDINILAKSGILSTTGTKIGGPAIVPMYLADFAGGGSSVVTGLLAALYRRAQIGNGCIIECSMLDSLHSLTIAVRWMQAVGEWTDGYESNAYDGGAHFYGLYRTADGRFLAVGAVESHFYYRFLEAIGATAKIKGDQYDREYWSANRRIIQEIIVQKPLKYWSDVFASVDACVTPVLNLEEARLDPHAIARDTFRPYEHIAHIPRMAPRFSAE